MRDNVLGAVVIVSVGREDNIMNECADAVVDAEAGFIPGVKGEEDGVQGEVFDTVRKGGTNEGGFEGVRVGDVVVEQFGAGLV